MNYPEFLKSKEIYFKAQGFEPDSLSTILKDFQKCLVDLAIRKGRYALFADTGLGKTIMQLEWAEQYCRYTNRPTLIVAPLSIARQTVRISKDVMGLNVTYVRSSDGIEGDGIYITNYEMLHHFDSGRIGQIVYDESSIFKAVDSKIFNYVRKNFNKIPYRLCCTATPSPNDLVEISNHAEVLGIMSAAEVKAMFFQNTGDTSDKWRMRPHGKEKFFRWLSSWSTMLRAPSDVGFSDEGYILPELKIKTIFIDTDWKPEGMLFNDGVLKGIGERNKVRRDTIDIRIEKVAEIASIHKDEQIIVWSFMNPEADRVARVLDDCRNVQGSDNPEDKAQAFEDFQDGKFRILGTKVKIGGFGMNFQNANIQIWNGIDDSWEGFYQGIRRSWRYLQQKPVTVYVVLADAQRPVWENILRKDKQANEMRNELIKYVKEVSMEEIQGMAAERYDYREETIRKPGYTLMMGDSVKRMDEIDENTIDVSVFSPPFESLFTYTSTERDIGNCKSQKEFLEHFRFVAQRLIKITKPGRNACVHVADIPLMKEKVGYMGMSDFPGDVIRLFQECGWIWYGRAFIDKNPQSQAVRTKAHALMFKTLKKDSAGIRPAIADQILVFKKPGKNSAPVKPVINGEMNNETWINWAAPVWGIDSKTGEEIEVGMYGHWYDIKESDTLKYMEARDKDDTRHICPLQLETIERCIKLYSNPGEVVFDPFGGVGSTAYSAIKLGRKAITIELKDSYFNQMVKNMNLATSKKKQTSLFDD